MNVPVSEPVGIVIDADDVVARVAGAAERSTVIPVKALGTGHSSLTVPVTLPPAATLLLLRLSDNTPMGRTLSLAAIETPPKVAVTVPAFGLVTADVVIANVKLVTPAGTDTLEGPVTAASVLARLTVIPPEGVAFVKVSVPVTFRQPATVAGEIVNALSFEG